jgi:putative inorganic carbon (hco3(-)) transporter
MKGLIFTYAMTFAACWVAPFWPYVAFLTYVAFANLKPEYLWPWSVPEGNYSRIVALALLGGWLFDGTGSFRVGWAAAPLAALVFYWFWLLIGAVTSPAQEEAWLTFEVLSKVFIPMLVGFTLINSIDRLKQLAWVLVLSHGFLALQFNHQYLSYGIDSDEWIFAGLDNNSIAITMVTALGLVFFLGMATSSKFQRLVLLGLSLLMAHVVLFSMSRGGMLAMCVSTAVAFWLMPKRPAYYAALLVGILVVVSLAGENVREEFLSAFRKETELDESAQSRFQLTRDAYDCMLRHPVWGCGMENWVNIAPEYGWPQGKRAHNTWMEVGATLGIPGITSLLAFYGICCWQMNRISRDRSGDIDPWITWMSRGVIVSIAGFFASAWFVTVDRVEVPFYVVLLGAGMVKLLHEAELAKSERLAREVLESGRPLLEPSDLQTA